ncbi:MFS general substrate transporter [Neurospora crassa]|uniref:Major facilitator family transporter n=2 Tax=Neurospora crassa (strain ATCC 24698 / 74-OR23-1A / CBS 708.71 / DSM 1257 / FGSC 987) TaxID=367110 RepID=V5IMS8_NEUCR|nr:major facilitator family transporter [Neurospora crassa OR74A]ESA42997.1 major facilitator family transporter [Neurospora crassa OR74A]KHE88780.1 MFS general substrate transporter [Neurospora crassa]|eukprot:XP_011394244.1 major facilitator family transporter [Neurospora crassa OR74A]
MSRYQNGQQLEATSTHIPIHHHSSREGSLTTNTNDNDPRLKKQEGEKPPVLDTHGDAQSSGISLPQFAQVDGVDESTSTLDRFPWKSRLSTLWHWKPEAARYDPDNPPKFTIWMNILFGFASCFTVSNLYYNQAVLNKMAETFNVTFEKASSVATLMQAGYCSGLLFICPLGDIFPRRPFILGLIAFTATLWIPLCLTTSFPSFAAISFLCGATTVTPQLMLPLVGDLAPPARRASSLAVIVSGLSLGVLLARTLAGVLASFTSWRNIYWFGLGVQWLVFALLYVWMPDYPSKNPDTKFNYFKMPWQIAQLLATEPLLLQAALVAFLHSGIFTSYWTTLSFLLSSPPYEYSSMVIGLFGLIGVVVIVCAPIYSRLIIDRLVPLVSAIMGLVVETVGVVVGTSVGSFNVAGPVVQAIMIDLGGQFTQIAMRSSIYGIQPLARNRVNTAYMVVSFAGQLTGTAVGNRLYAQGGWVYSGACGIAFGGFALIICLVRGPREKGWVGWSGGWTCRREDLALKKSEMATEQALEEAGAVGEGGEDVRRDVQSASASNGGNLTSDGKNQQ